LLDERRLKEKFSPPIVGNDLCLELASVQRFFKDIHTAQLYYDFFEQEFTVEKGYRECFSGFCEYLNLRYRSMKHMAEELLDTLDYHICFAMVEMCDKKVVADRVSIYAHMCGLSYHFLSNRLNSPEYSYSTCILALLMVNCCATREERREFIEYLWSSEWELSNGENGATIDTVLRACILTEDGVEM
jgi:hypothetical protein